MREYQKQRSQRRNEQKLQIIKEQLSDEQILSKSILELHNLPLPPSSIVLLLKFKLDSMSKGEIESDKFKRENEQYAKWLLDTEQLDQFLATLGAEDTEPARRDAEA